MRIKFKPRYGCSPSVLDSFIVGNIYSPVNVGSFLYMIPNPTMDTRYSDVLRARKEDFEELDDPVRSRI